MDLETNLVSGARAFGVGGAGDTLVLEAGATVVGGAGDTIVGLLEPIQLVEPETL